MRTVPGWIRRVVLAAIAAALVIGALHRAEAERRAWGEVDRAPVATRTIGPGEILGENNLSWRELPRMAIPVEVARTVEGRTAQQTITPGEVIVETRLASSSATGPDALVPGDGRIIAIPVDDTRPELSIGDRVDVYTLRLAGGAGSAALRVARDAVVLGLGERSATVAVTAIESPSVAGAVLDGTVLLVRVSTG